MKVILNFTNIEGDVDNDNLIAEHFFTFSVVTCDPPDSIGNGTLSPLLSVYNYSNVVTYTCDYGYYKYNGDLSRTCNEFAIWTGTKPVCLSMGFYQNIHIIFRVFCMFDFKCCC